MSALWKEKKFEVSEKSLIYNPQTVINFFYQFNNEFKYEIVGVDASSEGRTFKFRYLYYKDGIQKDAAIEFNSYDSELKYYLHTHHVDEVNFNRMFDEEIKFIQKYL
jgi:hypothetical protein